MKYTTDFFRVDTNPPDPMRQVLFIDKHSSVGLGWMTFNDVPRVFVHDEIKFDDPVYWMPVPSYYDLKHIENICK